MRILHNDMTVMVPTENAALAGLERIIDEETVEEVLNVLRDDVSDMPGNWNRRFKRDRDKIKDAGDIYKIAEVDAQPSAAGELLEKGLSSGEKQMYTRAGEFLRLGVDVRARRGRDGGRGVPRRAAHATPTARRPRADADGGRGRWRSRCSSPPDAASGWGAPGRRRWSKSAAGRCSSGASTALLAAPSLTAIIVALPPGTPAPPGCVGFWVAVRSASVRAALAAAPADGEPGAGP